MRLRTLNIKYRRTHVPTGESELLEFNEKDFIHHYGSVNKNDQTLCEELVKMWNARGIVSGKQLWLYQTVLVVGI